MGLQAPCIRESVSQAEFSSPASPRTPKRRQRIAHLQPARCSLPVLEYTGPGALCTGHASAPGTVSSEHLTCVHLRCQQLTQRCLPLYVQGRSALVCSASQSVCAACPVSIAICEYFLLFGPHSVRQVHARSLPPSWTSF